MANEFNFLHIAMKYFRVEDIYRGIHFDGKHAYIGGTTKKIPVSGKDCTLFLQEVMNHAGDVPNISLVECDPRDDDYSLYFESYPALKTFTIYTEL